MTLTSRALALPTGLALALLAGALTAWAGSSTPAAKAAAEGQAVVTQLPGNAKAFTYWSKRPDGWLVVTTVDTVSDPDTEVEHHAVVRFTATLKAGQSQEISVPQAAGSDAQVLRIERQDQGLVVAVAAE
jgi:hypothetical protein